MGQMHSEATPNNKPFPADFAPDAVPANTSRGRRVENICADPPSGSSSPPSTLFIQASMAVGRHKTQHKQLEVFGTSSAYGQLCMKIPCKVLAQHSCNNEMDRAHFAEPNNLSAEF
eukprot:m.110377 g.110377  ORF g.110377 m.110377 type:complete len:116 (+) comp13400_c0_seq1:1957-2304(+)